MPQFSPIATGAPFGKSIAELLSDEVTTINPPPALITTHATTTATHQSNVTVALIDHDHSPQEDAAMNRTTEFPSDSATESPESGVLVTGYISTTREDYQRDRAMESTSTRMGGGLLFDPMGGEAGLMSRDGPLGVDGHSYHVPAKCHTYIPDHLAGDDDYRKCWAGGGQRMGFFSLVHHSNQLVVIRSK